MLVGLVFKDSVTFIFEMQIWTKNNKLLFLPKVCTGFFYHFGLFHATLRSTSIKQRVSFYLLCLPCASAQF